MSEIALAANFATIVVVATIIGLIARQTGQPTIIAYILTGIILGPVMVDVLELVVGFDPVRAVVGPDLPAIFEAYLGVTEDSLVDLMAELGLGFLLFLLGMKMRFDDIRDILRPITNIAIGQTVLQTALAFLVAWALGFDPTEILVIALATVFGATPIIVKILTDKDEITSLPGKIDVGVLIVQDIYLVVVLALFSADSLDNAGEIATTLAVIFVMMGFIGLFSLLSSRYLLPKLFREIADNKDVFLIVAIAWAFLFITIAAAIPSAPATAMPTPTAYIERFLTSAAFDSIILSLYARTQKRYRSRVDYSSFEGISASSICWLSWISSSPYVSVRCGYGISMPSAASRR